MPSPLIQFRAPDHIFEALSLRAGEERGEGPGSVATRDLTRFYNVIFDELFGMHFSAGEAQILLHGHIDARINPRPYRLLWATIDDAIRDLKLDEKYGVDGTAFVERIRGLTPGQTMALIDLLERYWELPPEDRNDPVGTLKSLRLNIR